MPLNNALILQGVGIVSLVLNFLTPDVPPVGGKAIIRKDQNKCF